MRFHIPTAEERPAGGDEEGVAALTRLLLGAATTPAAWIAHQQQCPRCRDPFGVATPCNREDQP